MRTPYLSLVVVRSVQPDVTLRFYRALGCEFVEEQHGKGPLHHSCKLKDTVFEVYQSEAKAESRSVQADATMLGFGVEDLDRTMNRLTEIGSPIRSAPKTSAWGRRAVVADPDGRTINLFEAESTS